MFGVLKLVWKAFEHGVRCGRRFKWVTSSVRGFQFEHAAFHLASPTCGLRDLPCSGALDYNRKLWTRRKALPCGEVFFSSSFEFRVAKILSESPILTNFKFLSETSELVEYLHNGLASNYLICVIKII